MRTHRDLIEEWGEQQMADDLGATYALVHNWKNRNAIPYGYFPMLVTFAPLRGLPGLDYGVLFSLHRGPKAPTKSTGSKKNGRRRERTPA